MSPPTHLFDTNCCIYLIKGSHPVLRERIEELPPQSAALSAIVYAELCFGLPRVHEIGLAVLRRFAETFPVLPFDEPASEAALRVPFRRGRLDRLIAAHTLSLDATLITNNEADFADVPGLKFENWTR